MIINSNISTVYMKCWLRSLLMGSYLDGGVRRYYVHIISQGLYPLHKVGHSEPPTLDHR